MPRTRIIPLYNALIGRASASAARDLRGDATAESLANLIVGSRTFLATLRQTPLLSLTAEKRYFMFSDDESGKTSRPVNADLFMEDLDRDLIISALNCNIGDLSAELLTKIVYNLAMSYCAAADILKQSDQKTPGTFFEHLIGHIVARALGVNPQKQIRVPTLDMDITIPTDFVFDLGPRKNRVHLPIKISTRERVVQVWAHQRVLDGMHGVARFKGVLVAMAETNKQRDVSVTEVCLPNQWMAYQMYIAQMFRVYYLDVPAQYTALKDRYPFIQVRPFGEFYREVDKIERSGVGD